MPNVQISRRSRNLGYGWTNNVVQDGDLLRIAVEDIKPDVRGGLRSVCEERANAWRINSGNDWAGRLFVGGKRVLRVIDPEWLEVKDILPFLTGSEGRGATITVEVEEDLPCPTT